MSRLIAATFPRHFELDLNGFIANLGQFFLSLFDENPDLASALALNNEMRLQSRHWLA